MTDKEKRKEQILMKAHELAKSAKPLVDNMPLSTIIAATIEMAEWCDANPVKEPVSEDLEEAAVEYAATGEFLENGKELIDFQAEKAFKSGAQWQQEQGISFKGKISKDIMEGKLFFHTEEPSDILEKLGAGNVIVQIIKED